MNTEEYLLFLLNQFIPDGMKEEDLPPWVVNLRDKLFSTVFKKFKKVDEKAEKSEIAGFVSGAVKHLDESLNDLLSKSDIPTDQKISKNVLTRFEDEENLINSFVEGVNESQKELNSKKKLSF